MLAMRIIAISNISRSKLLGALVACLALLGERAEAATQGTLGETSTGSITITVSVAKLAQISGLSDVTLSAVDPASTATNAQSVCVWSNTATKGYSITASGSGPGSSFALTNGSMTAPYSVAWSVSSGQTSGTSLSPGAALTGLTSTATEPSCSSDPATTSSLIVTVGAADLQNMQAETSYSGTLNLLVSPI